MGSSEAASTGLVGPRARKWIAALLVIVGVEFCLVLSPDGEFGTRSQKGLVLAALLVALIPPVHRFLFDLLGRIRHPSPRQARIAAGVIAIVSCCYFIWTARNQGRYFAPSWQDERSYAIQVQMLAQGRLWMPPHPLADFFDSFQLIVDPVYASMYFPGASIFYVPAVWFGIPMWTVAALMAGACVGLIYLILLELIDGVAGALGALMFIGTSNFRQFSIMAIGPPAVLLLALLAIWSWLNWRRTKSLRWVLLIGIFTGWAAITRPLDAIILAMPIGVDMLLSLTKSRPRQWTKPLAILLAGAIPFLVLQIVFNLGVTGSWHRTPFDSYAERDYPGTTLGFHAFDPDKRPVSQLPQKQLFHDIWTIPAIKAHQPRNIVRNWTQRGLKDTFEWTLPHPLLVFLLPFSLLGFSSRPRLMLGIMLPLWIILYTFYTWLLAGYSLIVLPAVTFIALLGANELQQAWPRCRRSLGAFLALAITILCITRLHEVDRSIRDSGFDPAELRRIDMQLAALDHKSAVVLFRFSPTRSPQVEPVYNIDVTWPDDAPIIRAHDLGNRNIEIFRYYAQHQPDRAFYLYDRADGSIQFLGLAKDLARAN